MFNLNKNFRFHLFITASTFCVWTEGIFRDMYHINSICVILFIPFNHDHIWVLTTLCNEWFFLYFTSNLTLNCCSFLQWAEIICHFYLTFYIMNIMISIHLPFLTPSFLSLLFNSIFLSSLFSSPLCFPLLSSSISSYLFSSLLFFLSIKLLRLSTQRC